MLRVELLLSRGCRSDVSGRESGRTLDALRAGTRRVGEPEPSERRLPPEQEARGGSRRAVRRVSCW